MGDRTGIEYLRDRDGVPGATWNPTTGCQRASEGCNNCWAEGCARTRLGISFTPTCYPERLAIPLRWRRPRNIAVSFMGDLFHDDIPEAFIAAVWGVMSMAGHHRYIVCTKRPARARALLSQPDWHARMVEALALVPDDAARLASMLGRAHKPRPGVLPLPNVVFLFSAENQARFDERVGDALAVPAVVHGVSLEPLLGPVDFGAVNLRWHRDVSPLAGVLPGRTVGAGLDWVICGGESGPGARPMHPEWARGLRDQCATAGVPFMFKQWGEWGEWSRDNTGSDRICQVSTDGWSAAGSGPCGYGREHPGCVQMWRVGKRAAGRMLDGVTHDARPAVML